MQSRFTPGPWSTIKVGKRWRIYAEDARDDGIDWFIADVRNNAERNDDKANAELMAAAPDHAVLLAAMVRGLVRIEPLGDGVEICLNGMRHATKLDEHGCPILTNAVRVALTLPAFSRLTPNGD